MPKNTTSTKPL